MLVLPSDPPIFPAAECLITEAISHGDELEPGIPECPETPEESAGSQLDPEISPQSSKEEIGEQPSADASPSQEALTESMTNSL
ncbi:MAG: hypothetical protein V2I33_19270 [Kangiellaceae bacterium]|jgi:hypothetical protein|nr:hypothetical protein [Kangiellaceae bacterium]